MDPFEYGKLIYKKSREIRDLALPASVTDDEVQWAVEDLDDALLDLKIAVGNEDLEWMISSAVECEQLAEELLDML